MPAIFKHIRRKLASENKTAAYIRYAIGEIILVVIGILIALQVNNLNEERKSENIRQTYYQQMLDDIHKEKEYAHAQIDELNKSIASYEQYQEEVKNPNLKSIQIVKSLNKVDVTFGIFNFKMKSIDVLESTGDIKLMSEKIRDKLIDIKSTQEFLVRQQNLNDQRYLDVLTKAFALGYLRLVNSPTNFQGINVNTNITKIILTMESALALKNYTEKIKINAFNDLLKNLDQLQELIDKKSRSR